VVCNQADPIKYPFFPQNILCIFWNMTVIYRAMLKVNGGENTTTILLSL